MLYFATISSFNSPDVTPQGLTWDGAYLWHSDDNTNKIYKLQINGTVVDSWNAPSSDPKGLAWDGTYLWNGDWDDKIYKLQTDGTVVDSWNAPAANPTGLTWDGTYLWIVGRYSFNDCTIYKCQTDGTVVDSFGAPWWYSWGLAWDGTYLWVVNSGGDLIAKVQTDGTVIDSYATPANKPTGLTYDGTYWWNADDNRDKIFQLLLIARQGNYIAMSTDKTGTTWYAWLSGNDLKVNRLASETPTGETAITVDSSGDYDAVADVQYSGSFIRVVVRKLSDEKPYAFQSTDFGSSWSGPTDIS